MGHDLDATETASAAVATRRRGRWIDRWDPEDDSFWYSPGAAIARRNLEGRVIRRRRAIPPPPGVRSDLEVIAGLAERLGHGEVFRFASPEAVFDEARRASAGGRADYSGISYPRLDAQPGVFWPCPADDHPGTPRMFTERFAHPDGRARMVPLEHRPPGETPDAEFPLYLTTGRCREHYNSGAQTRRLERLSAACPASRLQLHPRLAAQLALAGGSRVVLESRRGAAEFEVEVTDGIRADTVFLPFHWEGEQAANLLTAATLDPISKMPELKVCAVRLRPA